MKEVLITFRSGVDYEHRRAALEAAAGWHAADHGLDYMSATLYFFDDAKAALAVDPLAKSPHVAEVRIADCLPRKKTRGRRV